MPLPKPKLLAGWRRAKLIALINELCLSFRGCGTCGVVVNALALSTNPQAGPLRYSPAFHLRRSKKPNSEPKLRPPAVSKSLTRSRALFPELRVFGAVDAVGAIEAGLGGASRLIAIQPALSPLSSGYDHIDFAAASFGPDQPLCQSRAGYQQHGQHEDAAVCWLPQLARHILAARSACSGRRLGPGRQHETSDLRLPNGGRRRNPGVCERAISRCTRGTELASATQESTLPLKTGPLPFQGVLTGFMKVDGCGGVVERVPDDDASCLALWERCANPR